MTTCLPLVPLPDGSTYKLPLVPPDYKLQDHEIYEAGKIASEAKLVYSKLDGHDIYDRSKISSDNSYKLQDVFDERVASESKLVYSKLDGPDIYDRRLEGTKIAESTYKLQDDVFDGRIEASKIASESKLLCGWSGQGYALEGCVEASMLRPPVQPHASQLGTVYATKRRRRNGKR